MGASSTEGRGDSDGRYRTPGSQNTTSSYDSQYPVFRGLGYDTGAQSTPMARSGGSYSEPINNSTLHLRLLKFPHQYQFGGPHRTTGAGTIGNPNADATESIAKTAKPRPGSAVKGHADAAYASVSSGGTGAGVRGSDGKQPPPKRPRKPELIEARRLESAGTSYTAWTGNMGVGMELNQEAQIQGEVGYETVTFTSNSSTRYVGWPYYASTTAKKPLMQASGSLAFFIYS
jgi:hypothetical protein